MLPELQQPNIVGNFLSSYGTAQAQQQAQQDRQRTMQRQDVADQRQGQQFDMQMDLGKLEMAQKQTAAMNEILSTVDPANPASLDMAKQRFLQTFGGDPQAVAGITMADIPRIKMQTGQTAAELDLQYKRAQIAATNRSNRGGAGGGDTMGGKAPSGYEWTRGPSGSLELAPIKGGPADPAKLQPGELSKIRGNNKQIDELENSLNSYVTNLGKTSPVGRLIDRGADVSRVETGHTDLLMQMKNLYELGVLNGPDYMLMTKIVEDPTSMMQVWRGNEGLTAQTDTVKSIINRARNLNNDRLQQAGVEAYRNPQQAGGGNSSGIPTVTTKAQFDALPSGAVYMEDDGNRYTKP